MAKQITFTEDIYNKSNSGGSLSVERDTGIIKNVKIIGFSSDNDRQYTPEALENAVHLYEGVLVNIDHPEKGPTQQRSSYDRFGKLSNVRFVEGKGLFGDLVYLKSHPMANQICEAAERMPELFGLSHNAQGEGVTNKQGTFIVSKVTEVRHVDVVADPATTHSLAESKKSVKEAAYTGVYNASKRRAPGARRGFVKSKSKSANKPTGTLREEESLPMDEKPDADLEKDETEKQELHLEVMQIITRDDMADDRKADAILELISNISDEEIDDMDASESKKMKEAMDRIPDKANDKKTDSPDDKGADDTEEAKDACETCKCEACGKEYKEGKEKEMMPEENPEGEPSMRKDEAYEEADDEEDPALAKGSKERVKAVKESKRFISVAAELAYYKSKDRIRELCESNGVKFDKSLAEDLSSLDSSVAERQIKRLAQSGSSSPKCATPKTLQESKKDGIPEGSSLFSWLRS